MKTDLAVLGGGPAGYSAALHAAKLGAKPVLVERAKVGGTCLHVGCIPTKALLSAAEVWSKAKRAGAYGLAGPFPAFALDSLHRRKREVVALLAASLEREIRARGVVIVEGAGSLAAPDRIEVGGGPGGAASIEARGVVLATGSVPRMLPGIERVPGRILVSDDLVGDEPWPRSIVIAGGGVVGVEFGCLLAQAGTAVTILEALPSLLPGEDAELGRRLAGALTAVGVKVRTGDGLNAADLTPGGVRVTAASGAVIEAEALLVAIGRGPVLDGIDGREMGIEAGPRGIAVDAGLRTTSERVWAAGDVTGIAQLAHVAAAQGKAAAAAALGVPVAADLTTIPRCVYSIPEVAGVGLTEEQARFARLAVRKGKAVFRGNPRAQAAAETDGFVKVLATEPDGVLVGVHAIGPLATELIAEAALAVSLKLPARRILEVMHPHPTFAEAFQEACSQVA